MNNGTSKHTVAWMSEKLRRLEEENASLKAVIQNQEQEIRRLRGDNPRGAGRRPADEKWLSGFSEFLSLKQAGADRETIMTKLKISRATFYRYQKLFNETKRDSETDLEDYFGDFLS